jgi:hypothetical protein
LFNRAVCTEDWVEITNEYHDGTSRLLGRYCNMWAPGPVESMPGAKALKVKLYTNEYDVASGFKARYMFNTRNKSILGGELYIPAAVVVWAAETYLGRHLRRNPRVRTERYVIFRKPP